VTFLRYSLHDVPRSCCLDRVRLTDDGRSRILNVGKSSVKPFMDQVYEIVTRCRRLFVAPNAHPLLSIACTVPKIFAVKVAVSLRTCERRQNRWFLVPGFRGRRYITFWTRILKSHSLLNMRQVLFRLSSVHRALRVADEKIKNMGRITVTAKSADH